MIARRHIDIAASRRTGAARGFTLIELLVVIVIIAGLASLTFSASDRVLHRARAVSCMGNLRNLGGALNLYLGDHSNVMPHLVTARDSTEAREPALDTVLEPYTEDKSTFRCPADYKRIWQQTGTSYLWNNLLNDQSAASLDFFGFVKNGGLIPVMSDKESFHKYRDVQVNILYADGHVAKDIKFTVGEEKKKDKEKEKEK